MLRDLYHQLAFPLFRLDRAGRLLAGAFGAFLLSNALVGGLLHVYVLRLAGDIRGPLTLAMGQAIGYPFMFVLAGYALRRVSAPRLLVVGLVTGGLFHGGLALLGPHIASVLFLVGLARAVSDGLFWSAHNLMVFDTLVGEERGHYVATVAGAGSLIGLVVPPVAGMVAAGGSAEAVGPGYLFLFAAAASALALGAVAALGIAARPGPRFALDEVGQLYGRNRLVWARQVNALVSAAHTMAVSLFVPILAYRAAGTEAAVGAMATVVGLGNLTGSQLASRVLRAGWRARIIGLGLGLVAVGSLGLAHLPSYAGLLVYALAGPPGSPFLSVVSQPLAMAVVERDADVKRWRFHYVMADELFIALGRLVVLVLAWLVATLPDPVGPARAALTFAIVFLVGGALVALRTLWPLWPDVEGRRRSATDAA